MPKPLTPPTDLTTNADSTLRDRRRFLAQLAGGAAALAASACTPAQIVGQTAAPPAPSSGEAPRDSSAAPRPTHPAWDLSWTERLTGPHRQVFDSPEIAEGLALFQARMFMAGYHDVYGAPDTDLHAVVVVRHRAIPMILGDVIWDRYDFIGKQITKLKDPTTGKPARRNPFLNAKSDDQYGLVSPEDALDRLIARGVIVLACNMALLGFAGIIAKRLKQGYARVNEELRRSLVPGVILMPSGIFAVARAEEAGCHYLRATG